MAAVQQSQTQQAASGERVTLYTQLVVREDGWSLYGFADDLERRFFQRLIGVSGVGPKIAIALLSALGLALVFIGTPIYFYYRRRTARE